MRRTAAGDAVFTPGLAGLVLGRVPAAGRRTGPAGRPAGDADPRPGSPNGRPRCCGWWRRGCRTGRSPQRLGLSHRTVQNHVQNTLGKLQLHNRVELTRYAIEQGLDD